MSDTPEQPTSTSSEQHQTQPSIPKQTLRLIPLEDTVVFPSMGITLTVDVGDDERVVLVPVTRTSSSRSARSPRSASSCGCPAAATRSRSPVSTAR